MGDAGSRVNLLTPARTVRLRRPERRLITAEGLLAREDCETLLWADKVGIELHASAEAMAANESVYNH